MEHNLPFDPTYGYTLESLLQVGSPAGPDDFESFWRRTYDATRTVPANPVMRPIKSNFPGMDVFEVEFDGLGGFRVGGWITVPTDRKFTRGVVVGHGYGGRQAPENGVPGPAGACLFICGRGFHRSARPDIPGVGHEHVLHDIDSREDYIHRFCVSDMWSAVTALMELFPQVGDKVEYSGGSFGGGIGGLCLPWEPRFRRAFLDVPSFGNHPIRLKLPMNGSGESVRQYYQRNPKVTDVIQYYDSATASRFTTIPVMVAAAVFDPAVPPPGQFAVYNALAGPRDLFVREASHFAWPGSPTEDMRLNAELSRWFSCNGG